MQFARLNDVNLHYQVIGSPASRPLLVFVNSLGTDFRIWRDVIVRLAGDYAILAYDMRGHGLSDVGRTPYSMELLADDLAALLGHIEARPAIVCGVSVGGIVAQQLYARRPDLVRALVLCDTAPKMGDATSWNARIAAIEADGIESIADAIMERWFTPAFRRSSPDFPGYRNMLIRQPMDGYIATCVALREADLTADAPQIRVPTLCIVGDQDGSAPPRLVADFAKAIPHSRFEIIKDCGHLPSIEQPGRLVDIMRAFISLAGTEAISHVSH
ncbi:MAG TPA: 3-oxoadipate enol-lactonase [Devosia sp.]|jgi:3-oxoadipate enol-lactonase|nr:3-oxoadipate enol-lactonase [Devosia sp.]